MDLSTITMPRSEARAKFLEYRRAVKERHDAEDEAIMRGYKALAAGSQLIRLADTISAGGVDKLERPLLAVAQADAQFCWMVRSRTGAVEYSTREQWDWRHRRGIVRLPSGTLPDMPLGTQWRSWDRHMAMVPPVPPALRPRHSLAGYHILWEAKWTKVAPKDPALLKHIGGDLYAVVAIWDLTELERAVLARRFTE